MFFIKPFVNDTSKLRPNNVLNAVNDKINSILKSVGNVKIQRQFAKQNIDFQMTGAAPVEYREGNEDPWAQMRQQIEDANLIIVDVADKDDRQTVVHKPNCYWELGYARALSKNVIALVDEDAGKIAFDAQDKIYIKYKLEPIEDEKDKYSFVTSKVYRNNLGQGGDPEATGTSYSFDNEIALFYTRLKTAMETSYLNRIILMKAANEVEKGEN